VNIFLSVSTKKGGLHVICIYREREDEGRVNVDFFTLITSEIMRIQKTISILLFFLLLLLLLSAVPSGFGGGLLHEFGLDASVRIDLSNDRALFQQLAQLLLDLVVLCLLVLGEDLARESRRGQLSVKLGILARSLVCVLLRVHGDGSGREGTRRKVGRREAGGLWH